MDFNDYRTRSLHAANINAGYSARLAGHVQSSNPHLVWHEQLAGGLAKQVGHMDARAQAWQHGWRLADRDEKRRAGAR